MGQVTRRYVVRVSALGVLAAESAHRVTGVASFILLANVGDQRLRMSHLYLGSGDQRVFSVDDNVTRFPPKFKATRKLHLYALPFSMKMASAAGTPSQSRPELVAHHVAGAAGGGKLLAEFVERGPVIVYNGDDVALRLAHRRQLPKQHDRLTVTDQ